MKKKLKALDVRIQAAAAAVLVIILGVAGYMFLVSPQNAQASKIAQQVVAEQGAIVQRRAELKAGLHPPTIETADIYRLARAMPDRQDMPGIILTLSEVAAESGIQFSLIEPDSNPPVSAGSYTASRIHLQFTGDFYGLSDFLYRLRSLVVVRNGQLVATGRLFNVDQLAFNVAGHSFPQISADLFVDAYVYNAAPAAAATPPATSAPTTADSSTTSAGSSLPTDASAAGATP